MLRFNWSLMGVAAAAIALAAPAASEPSKVQADNSKSWKHKPTGARFTPTLAGLNRSEIVTYTGNDTDVAAQYGDGQTLFVTVYLFRNVSGNIPVWFDRARTVVSYGDRYGKLESSGIRTVAPKDHANATGLMESFTAEKNFRSTGLAIFPAGDFYVKVRASSTLLHRDQLAELIARIVAEFDGAKDRKSAAAVPVSDCATMLPARQPAKLATANEDERMMAALLGGLAQQIANTKEPVSVPSYCREPGPARIEYGVYRPDGSDQRYMLALLDSGRAIFVGPDELGALVAEEKKPPRFGVSHVEIDRADTYPQFETLPTFEQVMELVAARQPLSSSGTWGKQSRNVTISTGQ